MIYSLTQELEDLLAVTYVMNSLLYILENEEGPNGTQAVPQPHQQNQGINTFSQFINTGIAEIQTEEKKASEMEASVQSVASVESVMPQDPTVSSTRQRLAVSEEAAHVPRESRSPSAGATRLLMRLEEENENLCEQVEVLERMNDRFSKRIKDLEAKLAQEMKLMETAETEKVRNLEEELEKTKKDDELKNQKISELVQRIEGAENELQLKAADHSETEKKLGEITNDLERNVKKMEIMEIEIRAVIEDYPKVDQLSVVKSYLHPEMARRAEEIVRDAVGPRTLRGDDAARYVSNSLNELYGAHWQAVLFRTDGHGCFVFHNNNCYIRFQLGNYQLVLFRY